MAVVGFAEVQVGPTFPGFQSQVNKAAEKLTGGLVEAGQEGGEKGGQKAAEGVGSKLTRGLQGAQKGLEKASAVVGLAAGAAMAGALSQGVDQSKAVGKMAAQMNLTKAQSKQIGAVAGKLYSQAYGDSMEDVTGAVTAVRSNIQGMNKASSKDLQNVTKNALDFANTFDVDVGEAAVSAGALVKNGLAKNGKEAFDLLTASAQKAGPQMTGPVLDATNEYSKHFKMLGIDGKSAMGTLAAAASGGEIAIDKAGDAVKEFGIRATDLNDTGAQQSLKDLGLNGQEMANKLLKGGKTAQGATELIAKKLLAIKDPAKQAAVASGLFGTQIEDIGKDNIPGFLKGLTGANDSLGKVQGRADAMGKSLNDNAATNMEQFRRQITQTFVDTMGKTAVPALTKFSGFLANNKLIGQGTVIAVTALGGGIIALTGALKVADTVSQAFAAAQTIAKSAVVANSAAAIKSAAIWTAQKTALIATTVAQKAYVAGAALMRVATTTALGPIGLVITGIAALAAGLVYAYKHSETFRNIVNAAFGAVKTVISSLVAWVTTKFVPFFTTAIPNAARSVLAWLKKNWPVILAIITGPIGLAVLAITKNWDKITGAFSKAKNWVTGSWKKAWGGTKNAIGGAVEGGRDKAKNALENMQAKFSKVKDWAGGTWKKAWGGAKSWIGNAVEGGRDKAKNALTTVQNKMSSLKDWGKGAWKKSWNGMKAVIADPVGAGKDLIGRYKNAAVKVFNALDDFGRKTFGDKWDGMKATITKPIQGAVRWLASVFGKNGKARTLFSGWLEGVKGIIGKLAGAFETPIKSLINVINKYLIKGGINWILNKLGVPKDKQVPWIPVPKFATGGPIGGRGGKRDDKNLIMASRGEFMQPADAVDYYGNDVMEGIRRRTIPREAFENIQRTGAVDPRRSGGMGLADGGLVGYMGGRFTARFAKVVMALSKMVPGFQMYQGGWNAGGVAASGGTHDKDAVDYGPATRAAETAGRKLGLAAWLRNRATGWTQTMPHVHAVPSPSLGDGSSGARAQYQNYLDGLNGLVGNGPDTGTRAYVGKGGSAGGIAALVTGALDFLKGLSPLKWIAKKVSNVKVGEGVLGNALSYVPKFIVDKAGSYITDKIESLADVLGTWTGGAVGSWNQSQLNNAATIIAQAKKSGVGQRGALVGLITAMQESTLNNLTGGDRDSVGLFQQRAPWGSFNARHNPAQAAWMFFNGGAGGQPGLKDKRGWASMSPGAAAQAVQVSAFPGAYTKWIGDAQKILSSYKFDAGGWITPGRTLVQNDTGKPEAVLTGPQWDAVGELVSAVAQLVEEDRKPRETIIKGDLTLTPDGRATIEGISLDVLTSAVRQAKRKAN